MGHKWVLALIFHCAFDIPPSFLVNWQENLVTFSDSIKMYPISCSSTRKDTFYFQCCPWKHHVPLTTRTDPYKYNRWGSRFCLPAELGADMYWQFLPFVAHNRMSKVTFMRLGQWCGEERAALQNILDTCWTSHGVLRFLLSSCSPGKGRMYLYGYLFVICLTLLRWCTVVSE